MTAFEDILNESHCYDRDGTVIADKGFASDTDFGLLEDSSLNNIIPLKRGNKFVKGRIPPRPTDYDEAFSYNKRTVQSKTFEYEDYNIHLFLDADLMAKELSNLTGRAEKKNISAKKRKAAEEKKAANGKEKLTQEVLDQLVLLTINDIFENKDEIGTITIKTNNESLNSFQVYSIYKQRQTIEQFFKTYADTMKFEASYMKDNYCEEAWLFLNHLYTNFRRDFFYSQWALFPIIFRNVHPPDWFWYISSVSKGCNYFLSILSYIFPQFFHRNSIYTTCTFVGYYLFICRI